MSNNQNLCRLCLRHENLNQIFHENDVNRISAKIVYCASIQISEHDKLPKVICNHCLFYVDVCYIFKNMCLYTEKKLRNNLEKMDYLENYQFLEGTNDFDKGINYLYDLYSKLDETQITNEISVMHQICSELNDKDAFFTIGEIDRDDETLKSKVGRHIAKKITGKCPRKLKLSASSEEVNISICNQTDVLLTDAIISPNEEPKLVHEVELSESEIPVVCFEETVTAQKIDLNNSDYLDLLTDSDLKELDISKENDNGDISNVGVDETVGNDVDNRDDSSIVSNLISSKDNVGKHKTRKYSKQKLKAKKKRKHLEKTPVDEKESSTFTCDVCTKEFPYRSHLIRHLNVHTGIKKFYCDYCSQKFANKYNLSVHLLKHTGEFPITCNVCNRGFSSPSLLKRHMSSHTGELNFHCKLCPKKFAQSSSLKLHESMHVNRPSYTCDICFKMFSYTNSLNSHKKTHLKGKDFMCYTCRKTFTRKHSLMRHMSNHDNTDKLTRNIQKYKCDNCDESLVNKTSFMNHLRKYKEHIKCEECINLINKKKLLIKHLDKHLI